MRRIIRTLAALLLPFAVAVHSAQAAPITSIEGTVGSNLLSVVPGGSSLEVFAGSATEFDGAPVGPFTTVGTFAFTVTGSSVANGTTTYSLESVGAKAISLSATEFAVFTVSLTQAVVNNLDTDTVVFQGTEILSSQSGPFDFSPFFLGGFLTLTVTATGADFNTLLASGGTHTGLATGTFTQTAIPEPASLLLLGTGLLTVGARRLRRKV